MKIRIQVSVAIPPFIEDCLPTNDQEREARLKKYRDAMTIAANRAATAALVDVHNGK